MNRVRAFIFKPRRQVDGKVQAGEFYHLRYRLPGEQRYREISLQVRDRAVAEEKRRAFVHEQEAEAAGIVEPKALRDGAQKRMADHLRDFVGDLEARGKDDMYVYNIGKRIGRLLTDCSWEYPKHVTPDSFLAWRVANMSKAPKTLNDYLSSVSELLKWMERQGKLKAVPLRCVGKVEARGKERRVRRELTVEEMCRLVEVAGSRTLAYLLAAHTGLRRAELESLQWGDVVLDTPRPFLRVRASTTKNHKGAILYLHGDLVTMLQGIQKQSGPVLERCPSIEELKADLTAARIPYTDGEGRVADFHALRHTLGTNLANAGVPRRVAMDIMRHSDSRMTDGRYAHVNQLYTAAAVEALPSFFTHTVKHTQKFVANGPALSVVVAESIGAKVHEPSVNTGQSHALSMAVTGCPEKEIGSPGRTRMRQKKHTCTSRK